MDRLSNARVAALTDLRRALHRRPELSGAERATAATVAAALRDLGADEVATGLGGHGVAGVIAGRAPGPTVLLRCELDALPIRETGDPAWRSEVEGVAHLCGHDGHMATLLGAAHLLRDARPATGRVVLMFQPAEEDGSGARAVVADPAFAPLAPDWAFALHNLPGVPRGVAHVPEGPVNCASRGLRLRLAGAEAHAAQPETGRSPAPAMAALATALPALSRGQFPGADFRLVTLTHMRLGEPAFGVAPGRGEVLCTIRTLTDAPMDALRAEAVALAEAEAARHGLALEVEEADVFAACANDPEAAAHLAAAARAAGLTVEPGLPERASEDFGVFGHAAKAAMLILGAGDGPDLHNPDYDFEDGLIAPGAALLAGAARRVLG